MPELDNPGEYAEMRRAVMVRHPRRAELRSGTGFRALLRLVVDRKGGVLWVETPRATGDPYIDRTLEATAYRLRFRPATLDGVPFDAFTTLEADFYAP